jgi:predicted transcriptional regulator
MQKTRKVNRSALEIMADIIRTCSDGRGAKKSRILYKANLSFGLVGKYLPILIENKLLTVDSVTRIYRATSGGTMFVRLLDEVSQLERSSFEKKKILESLLESRDGTKFLLKGHFGIPQTALHETDSRLLN